MIVGMFMEMADLERAAASPPRDDSTTRSPKLVLAAAMLGVVLVSLDVSVVNVALKSMSTSLSVGIEGLQWVLNVYTLAYAVCLLSAGALGDRIGPRATFLLGFTIFTVASLACGVAPSYGVLIAARLSQGVGAALLVPSAMAIIRLAYADPGARASAIGLWAGAGSLALAAGPIVGGALIANLGWRSIFLMNLPVGAVGLWLTACNAPRARTTTRRPLDLTGQLLGAAMLICLTGAVSQGGEHGWTTALALGGLLGAAVFGVALLVFEARTGHPMMPLSLFANPDFSCATYVGLVVNLAFYGLVFVFSLFFQTVQGRSALETGLAFASMTGVIMVVNVLAGRMSARYGVRRVMMAGLSLASLGYVATMTVEPTSSIASLVPGFLMVGCGIALTVPSLMAAALAGLAPERVGIGTGVHNAARQVGGALGVALFASFIASDRGHVVDAVRLSILVSVAALVSALLATTVFMSNPKS